MRKTSELRNLRTFLSLSLGAHLLLFSMAALWIGKGSTEPVQKPILIEVSFFSLAPSAEAEERTPADLDPPPRVKSQRQDERTRQEPMPQERVLAQPERPREEITETYLHEGQANPAPVSSPPPADGAPRASPWSHRNAPVGRHLPGNPGTGRPEMAHSSTAKAVVSCCRDEPERTAMAETREPADKKTGEVPRSFRDLSPDAPLPAKDAPPAFTETVALQPAQTWTVAPSPSRVDVRPAEVQAADKKIQPAPLVNQASREGPESHPNAREGGHPAQEVAHLSWRDEDPPVTIERDPLPGPMPPALSPPLSGREALFEEVPARGEEVRMAKADPSPGEQILLIQPKYLNHPKPLYPREARTKGYHGKVLLRVEVLADGQVGQIELKSSSGYAILDQSAIASVKTWKFIPAKKGGTAISFWVHVPIRFELQ